MRNRDWQPTRTHPLQTQRPRVCLTRHVVGFRPFRSRSSLVGFSTLTFRLSTSPRVSTKKLSQKSLLPWREKVKMRGLYLSPSPQSSPIRGKETRAGVLR